MRVPPIVAISLSVLVGALVGLAGSDNGSRVGSIALFALCALFAFVVNWLVYLPSFAAKTEKYFDLTGSLTYLTVTAAALLLTENRDLRSWVLAALIAIWAGRLGTFLFQRVSKAGHDSRFAKIKTQALPFLQFWTIQGLWVVFTAGAAIAAITAVDKPGFGVLEVIGLIVWIAGFGFEVASDRQKSAFKADPENKGRFISTGLWSWSRHPNYFGEITLWLGVAIIAFRALSGWQYITLISPIFVAFLLMKVSGVPTLERQGKKRWGDEAAYQQYLASTPVLVPRPPRSS